MNERNCKTRRYVIGGTCLLIAFVACTSGGETFSVVTECTEDVENDAGCGGGKSYSCPSGALPIDTDPTLVCGQGYPRAGGETFFCCATPNAATPCTGTADFVCPGTASPYVCSDPYPPSKSDPNLACESYGGANSYCCTTDAGPSSACTRVAADAGLCAADATSFVCPSNASPPSTDPTVDCSAPTETSDGDLLYCCSN